MGKRSLRKKRVVKKGNTKRKYNKSIFKRTNKRSLKRTNKRRIKRRNKRSLKRRNKMRGGMPLQGAGTLRPEVRRAMLTNGWIEGSPEWDEEFDRRILKLFEQDTTFRNVRIGG